MRVLALDTSGASQSVAVLEDERCLKQILDPRPPSQSETLLTAIDRILGEAGWKLSDLGLIALSLGPGSFTGLRIGLSTAKGLSRVTGVPLCGVSTLAALAWPFLDGTKTVVPCLDARCGEVYGAAYSGPAPQPVEVLADRAWPIDDFLQNLSRLPAEKLVIGDVLVPYRERFASVAGVGRGDEAVTAAAVGVLGLRRFQERGEEGAISPRYLRASEAENRRGRRATS